MIGDIMQPTHLLFVLAVALLVLGPKRLPEVGRQLGKGLRDFRAAINGESTEHHDEPEHELEHVSDAHQGQPPVEHQFAHETTETVAGGTASDHSSGEPAANWDQVSDEPTGSSGSAGEHEFAYEPPRPAEKPADPLS